MLLCMCGEEERAIADAEQILYEHSLNLDPLYKAKLCLAKAVAFYKKKQYQQAIEEAENAEGLFGRDWNLFSMISLWKGRSYFELGDYCSCLHSLYLPLGRKIEDDKLESELEMEKIAMFQKIGRHASDLQHGIIRSMRKKLQSSEDLLRQGICYKVIAHCQLAGGFKKKADASLELARQIPFSNEALRNEIQKK